MAHNARSAGGTRTVSSENPKVNYDSLAGSYDASRGYDNEAKLQPWLDELTEHGRFAEGSSILDVGCGTGRFAFPLAEWLGHHVVGLDVSIGMLEKARAKSGSRRPDWVQGNAARLPFRNALFDGCLMLMVIHHVQDKSGALKEMRRVLGPKGACLIVTMTHEQLAQGPGTRFFPKALEIDLARFPDLPVVIDILKQVGFEQVESHDVVLFPARSPVEYLEGVCRKHSSTLWLLPESDYRRGLAAAERFFADNPLPDKWRQGVQTLIVARGCS
jgi:ubiquinone/menaquinone biosynthesis C-methylase UbiE